MVERDFQHLARRESKAMAQTFASYEKYRTDFRAFEDTLATNGASRLREVRRHGLASFDRLGFPTTTRGNERWKYTNVVPIARQTFEYPFEVDVEDLDPSLLTHLAIGDQSWTRMVFVDGRYSQALSTNHGLRDGIRVANLADAVHEDGELVTRHLARHALADDDGFTAVNTAFLQDGAFVHVPADSLPDKPLHLVFLSTDRPEPFVTYPRILIVADPHSRLSVVESYVGATDASYFTDSVVEIVAGPGSHIEHYRYMSESSRSFHIGTTRVRLHRDSAFSSTSFARGARLARNDLHILLQAPGSSCTLKGLYVTSGTEHIDNHINIDHATPHTSSDQFFKGILDGRSRAVFSGRVLVRKDAQKTYARQSDKNLLLSEGARINTKPSLEIFADDVQCFHGATAGAMAQDALFYMKSRGLSEETARKLLIYGFASEIIDTVILEPLKAHLDGLSRGSVPGFGAALLS